jgi:E3 ubiquitin-protein ligase KEG
MLDPSEVELAEDEELHIGDWVKVRASVSTPTHQWGEVNHSSVGVVHRMENGDLRVAFCFMELARKVFVGHLYLIDDIAS